MAAARDDHRDHTDIHAQRYGGGSCLGMLATIFHEFRAIGIAYPLFHIV